MGTHGTQGLQTRGPLGRARGFIVELGARRQHPRGMQDRLQGGAL